MSDQNRRLVYSSEAGAIDLQAKARPGGTKHGHPLPPEDGVIRVARERRRASTASIVYGVPERELATTAKALKQLCGCGGTAKNGVIEIQGDHRERIVAWFAARGKIAKLAGG
uniref:SUI1 domain-containing protein n=1 Tax=mine drainage metagenome TaxID=410659 RepID=E6Q3R5_9ZZZZ